MSGNVSEWCHDGWDGADYGGDATDPWGDPSASGRVFRGGACYQTPVYLRVAARGGYGPDFRSRIIGFRLARSVLP